MIRISVIFILAALVFSGCIVDKQVTQSPESFVNENVLQSPGAANTSENRDDYSYPILLKEEELPEPEISLESFSSRYYRTNSRKSKNLSEKYYVIYHLTVRNNYPGTLNFKLHDFRLIIGDEKFNVTTMYSEKLYPELNLLSENVTLLPDQTINGSIVFQVNSSTNKSFLLLYNSTPLILPSFKKSIEAKNTAELFNYSIAFGIPQFNLYDNGNVNMEDLAPDELYNELEPYPLSLIWPNWINRSTIEFYKKLDSKNLENEYIRRKNTNLPITTIADLPVTTIKYTITVMPDKNIALLPGDQFVIKDERGKEIINESIRGYRTGLAILSDQMYEIYSKDIPQMNFINATIVQISFHNVYGWGLCSRITHNDQILIIDENQNIVIAMCHQGHFIS